MKNPNREDYSSGAHGQQQYNKALAKYNRNLKSHNESLHSSTKPRPKYDSRGRLKVQPKVDRMTRLPGGSRHQGGEIGQKSDKPSEGNFKKQNDTSNNKTLAIKTKAKDAGGDRSSTQASTPKDELATLKKKLKRHASGKNSVAKTKLKLKIRKLEGKK